MGFDIFEEWASSIDLVKTRVVRFPSLIFLCGGPISKYNNGNSYNSCRDIFYRFIKEGCSTIKKNIILAEEVFDYFEHTSYKDLLCFERDLAELSALTVIFLESPGSIAELGSFTVLEKVQDRLLVVIHEEDAHKKSFIWQGPILYLKSLAKTNSRIDPITIYNWKKSKADEVIDAKDFSDAEDLVEIIESLLNSLPKSLSFNIKQLGHNLLLILDILKIVHLATLEEILWCLKHLKVDYESENIEKHVSLLISLGLAARKPYRNNTYYLSSVHNPWLSWGYTSKARIRDVDRWRTRFIDYYLRNNTQKTRALRSITKANRA
jgi:hypothetical protein